LDPVSPNRTNLRWIQASGAIVNLRRVECLLREDGYMELLLRGRDERLSMSSAYQAAFRQV
jgi:DNA-binding LytR/AlgR family response regulator